MYCNHKKFNVPAELRSVKKPREPAASWFNEIDNAVGATVNNKVMIAQASPNEQWSDHIHLPWPGRDLPQITIITIRNSRITTPVANWYKSDRYHIQRRDQEMMMKYTQHEMTWSSLNIYYTYYTRVQQKAKLAMGQTRMREHTQS